MGFWMVLSTVPTLKQGKKIARALVAGRLTACVNILPQINSVFYWEGQVRQEKELLLLAKTVTGKLIETERKIKELHPYSVPEIIFLKVGGGEKNYLNWVQNSVKRSKIKKY